MTVRKAREARSELAKLGMALLKAATILSIGILAIWAIGYLWSGGRVGP